MKKFKKFLVFVVSVFLLGSCMFISACNQEQNKNILLDKTSVSIIYGQTENNTVEVVATLENFDVGSLDLIYEPSNYFVITSTKVKEQTFSITIKANAKVAIEPTLVEVKSGNVSTYFYLEIVLPVESITANSNLYIPFLGETPNMGSGESDITYHNLKNFITFNPVDTKQTDVTFSFNGNAPEGASIVGNNLVIDNKIFKASTETINIIAASTNNSDISTTTLSIKVVPSIKLIADKIEVKINTNGIVSAPNSKGYNLTIDKSGIETFEVIVKVPSSYNIDVNVNTASGSILDVLSCSKTKTENGDEDVYTFVFTAISISSQGAGALKFDYSYKDDFLKSDENLSAAFLCYDSVNEKIVEFVNVNVVLPITKIEPDVTNLKESTTVGTYITYVNYGSNTLGEKLSFKILPEEVIPSRKKIILTLNADSKLQVIKSDGTELLFDIQIDNQTKSATISANEIIYIKGTAASDEETLTYYCESNKEIKGEIKFKVKNGINAFGFVESKDSTTTESIRTIYGFKGDTQPTCIVYAEDGGTDDNNIFACLIDNVDVTGTIESIKEDYFKITFPADQSGIYTITTTNGHSIQAEVILYNKLTSASVSLKKDVEFLSGVGDYKITNKELVNLSIKNGYSVELNYTFNNDSTYEAVKYSFYEPKVNVYDTVQIANLKALKNDTGNNLSNDDFSKTYSSFINTSNLNSQKLITAIKSGITIVKIDFFDKKIENGKIMGAAENAATTKYLFVQVYDPVKSIESTAKNITLRVTSELSSNKISLATQTIKLNALSNANKQATYNKVFLKDGTISSESSTYTHSITTDISGNVTKTILTATLNNSNELEITAYNRVDTPITLELFAVDFVDSANDYSNLKSFVKYVITVTLIKTEQVSDISVTNLNLESESENVKTYEQVYIDLSKNVDSVKQFKLNFEITPAEALEKELNVEFTPTNGTSKDIINVTSNGLITILGEIGGTGNIEITLKNSINADNVKKVLVPIVIADGESYATAFEISSLSEIKDSNKHYVLTIPTTYIYSKENFIFESFNGGLYGKRYSAEDSSACATIKLNDISLFKTLGADAHIENLNICGTVKQTTSTGNIGFVAETNNGTINNVKVTTYIYNESNNELNGEYVPSVLKAINNASGGLVGTNVGTISNCSFAGSIDVSVLTDKKAYAIAGTDSGTISNCTIIIAKFNIEDKTKVVKLTEESKNIYINGLIGNTTDSFDNSNSTGITTKSYSEKTFTGDSVSVKTKTEVCYGENKQGIVFYYQAVDSSKQSSLKAKNTIKLDELLSISSSSSSLAIADLKVRALNPNGSICNFVGINADSITLYGVGEFVLEVSSQYDYTTVIRINLVSMHYFSNFTITFNGKTLTSSDDIQIVVGQTAEIVTKLTHSVKISGVSIELIENTFDVVFGFVSNQTGADGKELDIKNYITNTKLGVHTINMDTNFVGSNTSVEIYVTLTSNYSDFDTLINNYLNLKSETANFTITKKIGTTAISANISHGEIEPKDTLSFVATITTDAEGDKVEISDVEIYTSQNIKVTEYFDIKTEPTGETNKFNVYVGLIDENKTNNNYVNKTYTIVVGASNGSSKYDAKTTLTLTVLPQAISNINTTLYKITNKTTTGVAVSELEPPTSSLLPTQSGMFVVNMFPAYATYDYLEIVSESSTLTTLSFKLQEKNTDNKYINASSGFEQINGKNGIRIIKDNNNTNGEYYIKIGANADFVDDTIFNLTVNAYYEGKKLAATSSFTLYVKAPEEPEISLNGETRIYRYAQGGGKIENITAVIAGDQINPSFYISATEDKMSTLDNKSISNISVVYERLSNNAEGYAVYKITLLFKDGYNYNSTSDSTQLKLVAKSTKISQGEEIEVSSEMYIYIVDAEIEQDDIVVSGALDKNFNVTNFNASEFMLALSENIKASDDFKNAFNALIENNSPAYYFKNQNTGFTFGETKENYTAAQTLANYLYFANGNNSLKVFNEETGIINDFKDSYDNYVKFFIEGNKLYVQGGALTGSVEMLLKIPYTMPSGAKIEYDYKFTITNNQYTTEDIPKEIADGVGFLNISNEKQAQDYILNEDLFLSDFTTIENTDKIKSLDGNNHTITITSFAEDSTLTDYALFKQISEETTIKNLTINLYYLSTISIQGVTKVNVAGLAIQNDGVVYNCEVMAYYKPGVPNTTSTHGIKIEGSAEANVAGLVLTNNGSITNSRVGGSSKTIAEEVSKNGVVTTQTLSAEIFEIKASGTISGFVEKNTGVISSSFVKNISIQNSYNKQETKVTTGFVNENTGTIVMSYAEGGFTDDNAIQSNSGGIEAVGIMSGFVYSNQGTITDCYSNLRLTNSRSQVGRMGAGFVYQNGENGTISRAYSASTIVDNNITQMNFAGITDYGEYNNKGVIDTAYYYISSDLDKISIESIINTSITEISDVTNSKTFYGFSFINTEYGASGTWSISSSRGPSLVNANNIAKSIRYKKKNTTGQNNNVEYLFPYCVGYELGTTTNPIIIRDAEEFNSVFGASKSTDIQNNYSTASKKIYGSYRIVNNLDMLSLVPKSEQETEYKVNLLSTSYTLTGEEKATSKKGGSLEGNGLTIKNLAISNSSATSNEFGLFKSLENGASISNINIELANGGVGADHTTFVGTIAGTLKNSSAYNISIKSYSVADSAQNTTKVIGANVTGGVFGRVIGTSTVSNINVENISVTSTNHITKSFALSNGGLNIENEYDKTKTNFSDLSIAGGAFGVLDFYQNLNDTQENAAAQDQKSATTINIHVTGGMVVEGMTAGGVVGYVGSQVVARDLSLVVLKDSIAKINAYNCYAGGIAGFSKGYLYQLKAEHESEWQTEIENNMQNYYLVAGGDASVDRGNESIFESDVDYKPFAIGGLVGGAYSGQLSIGYSKINVINQNAQNAGGIVGYVYRSEKVSSSSSDFTNEPLKLNEIYAVGDVYSAKLDAKIGGIIGTAEDYNKGNDYNDEKNKLGRVIFEKVNALNYWGYESANKTIGAFFGSGQEYTLTAANAQNNSSTNYSIKEIKFGDASGTSGTGNISVTIGGDSDVLTYYDYSGINSDNGAIINLMFKENDWYKDKNWSRDVNETFPHINYVYPTASYLIESVEDFYKFILHGSEDDAIFIIAGKDGRSDANAEDYLIDCTYWGTTIGSIRGNIVGLTNLDGFTNLHVPLFSNYYNGTISGIILKDCSAPLVITSNNCTYRNITLEGCTVTRNYNGNAGVLTVKASDSCKFDGITFKKSKLTATATNGGLLFGCHTGSALEINNITIDGDCSVSLTTDLSANDTNFGLLFGLCSEASVSNVVISNNASLTANVSSNATENSSATFKVGLIAGSATTKVTITSLKIDSGVKLDVKDEDKKGRGIVYIGGLVGYAEKLEIFGEGYDSNNMPISSYYSYTINVSNMDKFTIMYLGYACGSATTINVGNGFIVFGCTKDKDNNYTFNELTVSTFASTNNFVGGIAGNVKTVTGTITTDTPTSQNGYIAYYGDLIIDVDNSTQTQSNYLYIGGAYGTASISICNTVFEGTISFKNEGQGFSKINVGGIVGYVDSLSISNSIASGEINLPKSKVGTTQNFAGIVGMVKNELTFADCNVIALTTVFSSEQSNDLDAVVNCINSTQLESNKAKYCSAVTLSVSKYTDNSSNCDFGDLTGTKATGTGTCSCTDCTSTCSCSDCQNNGSASSSTACSCPKTLMDILKQNAPRGSKLNAYGLDSEDLEKNEDASFSKTSHEDKFLYHTTTTNSATTREYISTKNRKLYINLGDAPTNNTEEDVNSFIETKVLQYQISLDNAIVFSAGAEIWSTHTPFDKISETSAVSGVVARVYIDETKENTDDGNENNKSDQALLDEIIQKGENYTNAAGFVNTNEGIVYICSVQETFNSFNTGNTQFQAYLNNKSEKDNYNIGSRSNKNYAIAGFVHKNSGYIFGSNTNIKIQTNKESVTCHGFVAQNSGTIEFSYASGVNNGYMDGKDVKSNGKSIPQQHTLFAPVAYILDSKTNEYNKNKNYTYGINNCYTIVMAKGIGIDANLPSGVVAESDACEITIDNSKTIYGDASTVNPLSSEDPTKQYFACDSLYNHNYPTISGGPFDGITYSKRVTMVERKTTSTDDTDDTIVFKELYVSDLSKKESDETTLLTASTYYFTIPNLTVLKQLSGLMSDDSIGTSQQSTEDKVYHSKFVLINDINVCYDGTAYSNSITITGNTSHETIIEGLNHGLFNLNLSSNLFESIDGNSKALTLQNIKFGAIVLQGATGIFGTIGTNATLDNIQFIKYTEPKKITLSGVSKDIVVKNSSGSQITRKDSSSVTLETGDEISVATITSTSSGSTYGILASTNNGTIKNSSFNIDISANDTQAGNSESKGYTLGGYVGKNSGTVEICTFSGKVTVIEENEYTDSNNNNKVSNTNFNVTFGTFIGTNTGTAERLSLKDPNYQTLHVMESGDVLTEQNNKKTGESSSYIFEIDSSKENATNANSIQGCCVKEYQTQIYVKTSGEAYVGGIVGINGEFSNGTTAQSNGTATQSTEPSTPLIEQCYTDYKCKDDEYAVFVGDERYQMVAYAGGIVGFSNSGTIKNCANISNVAAMSVWQKTTADEYKKITLKNGNNTVATIVTGSDGTKTYYDKDNNEFTKAGTTVQNTTYKLNISGSTITLTKTEETKNDEGTTITDETTVATIVTTNGETTYYNGSNTSGDNNKLTVTTENNYLYSPNSETGIVDKGSSNSNSRVYYSDAVNIENVVKNKGKSNDLASIYNMFVGEKNIDLSRIPIYKAFFDKFTTKVFNDDSGDFHLKIGDSENGFNINNRTTVNSKKYEIMGTYYYTYSPAGWTSYYTYSYDENNEYSYYLEYPTNSSGNGCTGYKFTIKKITAKENTVEFTFYMQEGSWNINNDNKITFSAESSFPNNSEFTMVFKDKSVCRIYETDWESSKDKTDYVFDWTVSNNVQEYLVRYFSSSETYILETYILSADGTLGYYVDGGINVYQERSSLAYAGGIAGGMSSSTTYTQVADYGNVNAGYRAIKPIEQITAKDVGSTVRKLRKQLLMWSFLLFGIGSKFGKTLTEIARYSDTPTFYVTKFLGTSPRYMSNNSNNNGLFEKYAINKKSGDLSFINVTLGSPLGYYSEECEQRMNIFYNLWFKEGVHWYKKSSKHNLPRGRVYYHGFKDCNEDSTWKYEDATTSKIQCFNFIFGNNSDPIVPIIGTTSSEQSSVATASQTNEIYVDSSVSTYTNVTNITVTKIKEELTKSYQVNLIKLTELSGSNKYYNYYYFTSDQAKIFGDELGTEQKANAGKQKTFLGNIDPEIIIKLTTLSLKVDVSRITENNKSQKQTLKYNSNKASTNASACMPEWKKTDAQSNSCWTLKNGYYIPETKSDLTLNIKSYNTVGLIPNNTIGFVGGKYSVTITNAKVWEKLVNTLNMTNDDNRTALLQIDVTVNLNNNQTEINVGNNLIDEFNGTITVQNNTPFEKVNLSQANSTNLGFIGKTIGCTLNNVTISGVGLNGVSNNSSVGLLIGSVGDSTVSVQQQEPVAGGGGVSAQNEPDTTPSVTLNNVKINSVVVDFKNTNKTDIIFGGLVGSINSGSVTLNNVELSGSVKLVTGITYAGGLVGNNAGTLTIGKENSTSSTNINLTQLSVASSQSVVVVGGVVGCNSGTITVNENFNIGTQQQIIISADVTSSNANAYAGGLIGKNCSTNANIIEINNSKVTFGSSNKGYSNVGYVLAGFNVLNESNDGFFYPSAAYASTYIAVTYNSGTLTNNTDINNNITYGSFVSRWIYRSSTDSNGEEISNNNSVQDSNGAKTGSFTINGITYNISGENLINNLLELGSSLQNLTSDKTTITETTKTNADGEEETESCKTKIANQKIQIGDNAYTILTNSISATETTYASAGGQVKYNSSDSENISAGDVIYTKTTTLTYYMYKTTANVSSSTTSALVNGTHAYYFAVEKKIEYFKPNNTDAFVTSTKTLEYALVLNDVNYEVNQEDRYNLEIYQLSDYIETEQTYDVTLTANKKNNDYDFSYSTYPKNGSFKPKRVYGGMVSDLKNTKILNKLFEGELESSDGDSSGYTELFNASGDLVLKIISSTVYKDGSNNDVYVNSLDEKIYLSSMEKFNIKSVSDDEKIYVDNKTILTEETTYYDSGDSQITDSSQYSSAAKTVTELKNGSDIVATIVTTNGETTYYNGSNTSGDNNKLTEENIYYDSDGNKITDSSQYSSAAKTVTELKNGSDIVATILSNTTIYYVNNTMLDAITKNITLKNGSDIVATIVTTNGETTYYNGSNTSGDNNKLTEENIYYDSGDSQITDSSQYSSAAKTVTELKKDSDTVATIVTGSDGTTKYYYGSGINNEFTSVGTTYKLETSGNGDTITLKNGSNTVATIITYKYTSADGKTYLTATTSNGTTTLTQTVATIKEGNWCEGTSDNKLTSSITYYDDNDKQITDQSQYSSAAKTVTELKNDNTTVATIVTESDGTQTYYNGSNTSGDGNKLTATTIDTTTLTQTVATIVTESDGTQTYYNGSNTSGDDNKLTRSVNQDGSTSYVNNAETVVFKENVKKYTDDNNTSLVAINNDDITTVYNILVCIEQTSDGKTTTYKDASGNEFTSNGSQYKLETSGDKITLKNGDTTVATITQTTTYKDASGNEFTSSGSQYKLETLGDKITLKNGDTTVATIVTESDGTQTYYNGSNISGDNNKLTESIVTTALSCGGLYATFESGKLTLTQKIVVTKTEENYGTTTTITEYTNEGYIDGTKGGNIPTVSFGTITLPTMQANSVCGSNSLKSENSYTLNLNCTYFVVSSDGQTQASFSVDKNNNVIYAIDASGNSLTIDTTSEEGSTLLKEGETTKVKLTFNSTEKSFSATDGSNPATTYSVTQNTTTSTTPGTYTSGITLGGEIKLDYYCEFKFKYDGSNEKEVSNIAANTYTFNGKNYLVVTCRDSSGKFTDYVYLISNSNFYSCGNISYDLGDSSSGATAYDKYSEWFSGTAINRYPSFVPKNVDNFISNIQDNLVQPNTIGNGVSLSITKNWQGAQVDITAIQGELFYSYTTTYTTYNKTYNISSSYTCTTCTCDECGCKTGGTCTCTTCTHTVSITEDSSSSPNTPSSTTPTIDNDKTTYTVNSNGTIKVTYKDSNSNEIKTTTYVFVGGNNLKWSTTDGGTTTTGNIIAGTSVKTTSTDTPYTGFIQVTEISSLPNDLQSKTVYSKQITIGSLNITLYIATESGQGNGTSSTVYYVYNNNKLTELTTSVKDSQSPFAGFYTINNIDNNNFANITK